MKFLEAFVRALSSLWLSATLLILLALLTWLGTLEQVHTGLYDVQKKYFESLFLVHDAGGIPIPLPGATLVMGVLFVNIIVGGILRMRRGFETLGILVTHLGIAFLLVAGFIKAYYSEDGHVTLFEGERANTFESYHRWEIAVLEKLDGRSVREVVAPEERFSAATAARPVRMQSPELPFEVQVTHFLDNARVLPKGPMVQAALPVVDGFFLERLPKETQNEANIAGAYVSIVGPGGSALAEGILWGAARQPLTVELEGKTYGVELRREQYLMPFTIEMVDFVKEDHPGINMPKAFSSDVTVLEHGSTRPVKIEMNEPLRSQGLVLYQSSWGPSNARPGDRLFSTLAVVRNPADQYPLYACIVIAIGLVLHFSRKLFLFIRSEARRTA
jgi:hypothetical protein